MLQSYLDTKLTEFVENVYILDSSLTENKHKKIIEALTRSTLDIRSSFYELIKTPDLTVDQSILNAVRDVSIIKVNGMESYDAFNTRTLKVKPELIDFLGRYLIKRRATYLYIYMLLQQRNTELIKILKLLGNKFYELQKMVIPENGINLPVFKIEDILIQLNNELQKKIKQKNPSLADDISKIFNLAIEEAKSTHSINYIEIFASIGELINLLNSKTNGYQLLITDIIPLMANWNDNIA